MKTYIDFLNCQKNFKEDRKYFDSYEEAEKWAKESIWNFHPDMIKLA